VDEARNDEHLKKALEDWVAPRRNRVYDGHELIEGKVGVGPACFREFDTHLPIGWSAPIMAGVIE